MDALRGRPRLRIAPVLEWVLAVVLLLAGVWLGTRALAVFRAAPVTAEQDIDIPADIRVPAAVPARAVSVPRLPLQGGLEIRVGDTLTSVAERLGRGAEMGLQDVDRGAHGERLTRFYEYDDARFILVFESIEANGAPRVAAIYLP